MYNFFQKIKRGNISISFLILLAIIISISGIRIFKTEAATSYIGGASNSLYLGGGAILGVDSPAVGLAVLNGNVGIGAGSPNGKLHLYSTSGELVLRLQNAATGGRNWELNSKNSSGSFSIIDRTATADRLLISSSGNVGIGLTNPTAKLHVSGDILSTGTHYLIDTNHYIRGIFGTGVAIGTYGASDGIMLRQSSGNVGIGTTNPNYKLDVIGGISTSAQSRFGANVGVYGGELFVEGDITTYGDLYAIDIGAPLNVWGACVEVSTTASCGNEWYLTCPNGRFMTKITNVGGSNTCIKKISCCHL